MADNFESISQSVSKPSLHDTAKSTDNRTPPVAVELNQLAALLEDLEGIVNRLGVKLSPVLGPDNNATSDKSSDPDKESSPLVEEIKRRETQVIFISTYLQAITNRLEI